MSDGHRQPEQGSFLTGFTIGLFAGAAGYYLFATDRGRKLREHLAEEWENAQEELARQKVIDRPGISLREFVREIMERIGNIPNQAPAAHEETSPAAKPRLIARSATKAKRETRRFHGT